MNDVCLLLEGTFPYVAGGVSTWVYELIRSQPDTTFSIVFLGPHRRSTKKMHYEIPDNVRDFREYYLFDYEIRREWNFRTRAEDFKRVQDFLVSVRGGKTQLFAELEKLLGRRETRSLGLHDLIHSWRGWQVLEDLYRSEPEEQSLLDYFWTWRFLYAPFFSLLRLDLPPARLYHSASTGYAGVLGAIAKLRYRRPFLLTEHGIYTRERKLEISRADWIYSEEANQLKVTEGKDFFKEWWIQLFEFFSRLSYDYADEITTLFEENRRLQIQEGADPKKLSIIPNGVQVETFRVVDRKRRGPCFKIGFVGRVVPIKDVKTFIRACKLVHAELSQVEASILGPTDEDEEYYHECVLLTEIESLTSVIHFKGKVDVRQYYPELDVLVLTSISEGQPIVLLEAMASGVPCVATEVGSCPELLLGKSADDKLLGASGIVTPLCDPQATAAAVLEILKDPQKSLEMGEVGRKRVERFYRLEDVVARYQRLYDQYVEQVAWPA